MQKTWVKDLSSTAKEIVYKLENLKELLEDLKHELSKVSLDRNRIQNLLFGIKELLDSLKILLKRYSDEVQSTAVIRFLNLAQKAQSQKGAMTIEDLRDLISIFNTPKLPIGDVESLSSHIGMLLTLFTHASDKLSDEYYREKLYEVVPKIEAHIEHVSASIGAEAELGALPKLGRLISSTTTWGFGENWVVAIAYLQALEVVVNKLVKELGIQVKEEAEFKGKEEAGFKRKFRALVEALKDKAVELARLEEQLPQLFWDLRHKVVHAGYEPNNTELNTIITWTLQILEKFKNLKPNKSVQ